MIYFFKEKNFMYSKKSITMNGTECSARSYTTVGSGSLI